ncbi:hypothetical protein, partial [Listeria monocytogenes]|uniref:hypothetical protein n=1 Tax=Listeria monocytogenes TaxID=1639 RepID=UPI001C9C210E
GKFTVASRWIDVLIGADITSHARLLQIGIELLKTRDQTSAKRGSSTAASNVYKRHVKDWDTKDFVYF